MLLSKANNQIGIILFISNFNRIQSLPRKRDTITFNTGVTMTTLS